MKPSILDLQFLQARAVPQWARDLLPRVPDATPLLHAAINRRAGEFWERQTLEKRNACAVLRMVRRRGVSPREHMREAVRLYARVQPERVKVYLRWLRRLAG